MPSTSNYFLGGANPVNLTDVANYASVTQQAAPGVSVVYHGNGQSLQFDLHVAAGADPAAVDLVYGGVQSMSVDGQGRVLLHTAGGDVLQETPTLYQDVGGTQPGGRPLRGAGQRPDRFRRGRGLRPHEGTGARSDVSVQHLPGRQRTTMATPSL